MIIVTGGAGFIGANLIAALNRTGHTDLLVVDHLQDGTKFSNLCALDIRDFWDKTTFIKAIEQSVSFAEPIEMVFHQGACSVTTEWDGQYMMQNNYTFSKTLLHYCLDRKIPFIYASSASVYGLTRHCSETQQHEAPLNVYAYSKYLFDQYVRRLLPKAGSQIIGLRYFNVYGPGEQHKGPMASVVWHFRKQLHETGTVRLFGEYDGFAAGEQRRDFVYVDDVAAINLWFMQHPQISGLYNVGTGLSRSFNDLVRAVIAYYGVGEIEYIPFPESLKNRYQSFTEADISALRSVGYSQNLVTLEQGVTRYLDVLETAGTSL